MDTTKDIVLGGLAAGAEEAARRQNAATSKMTEKRADRGLIFIWAPPALGILFVGV